jgi:hypothetical protein
VNAIIGAVKGASGTLVALVLVALIPGVPFVLGYLGAELFGWGFWTVFFTALALEVPLGLGALMGIATEVQRPSVEAVREASRARESHS